MLVLTQLSVGGFLVELASRLGGFGDGVGSPIHLGLSLGLGYVGLGASLLHLGRPLFAYRAILGWRHSWLSREVARLRALRQAGDGVRRGGGPRVGLARGSTRSGGSGC